MKNTLTYCAPKAEDCTLLQDDLLCYSGDGSNEDYGTENFTW